MRLHIRIQWHMPSVSAVLEDMAPGSLPESHPSWTGDEYRSSGPAVGRMSRHSDPDPERRGRAMPAEAKRATAAGDGHEPCPRWIGVIQQGSGGSEANRSFHTALDLKKGGSPPPEAATPAPGVA